MAERRMFTKKITDSDEFISLPSSTQALYLHLTMSADDDGFNNQVQMAIFKAHASLDDLRILLAKRFIIQFSNGVIVIKHWRMANALRKDRYTATAYQEELKMLKLKDNGAYSLTDESVVDTWLPDGCQMVAPDKNSIGKDSIEESMPEESGNASEKKTKKKYGEYKHVLLTDEEHEKLKTDFGENTTQNCITFLDEYIEMKGYKAKSHYLCIRKWVVTAVKERKAKEKSVSTKSTFNNIENHTDWNDDFYNSLVDN